MFRVEAQHEIPASTTSMLFIYIGPCSDESHVKSLSVN